MIPYDIHHHWFLDFPSARSCLAQLLSTAAAAGWHVLHLNVADRRQRLGKESWSCHVHCNRFVNSSWLVVWNIFYFPINIGNVIIPIDVHIFQRGGPTTNQSWGGPKSWGYPKTMVCFQEGYRWCSTNGGSMRFWGLAPSYHGFFSEDVPNFEASITRGTTTYGNPHLLYMVIRCHKSYHGKNCNIFQYVITTQNNLCMEQLHLGALGGHINQDISTICCSISGIQVVDDHPFPCSWSTPPFWMVATP